MSPSVDINRKATLSGLPKVVKAYSFAVKSGFSAPKKTRSSLANPNVEAP